MTDDKIAEIVREALPCTCGSATAWKNGHHHACAKFFADMVVAPLHAAGAVIPTGEPDDCIRKLEKEIEKANHAIRGLDLENEALRISLAAARREKIPGKCEGCDNYMTRTVEEHTRCVCCKGHLPPGPDHYCADFRRQEK